jgi:hypothetical protein
MFVLVLLTACSGNATSTPIPDAATLLKTAATEIEHSSSFKIKLQVTGAPTYVDPPSNKIAFVSANGLYVAPDKLSATVVAKILSLPGEVQVVAIGDNQWMKNQILTAGQWLKGVFSPGFNAGNLISSDTGIQAALNSLRDVKYVGHESINGTDMVHLTAVGDGAQIASLTVGLIHGNLVNMDIYIVPDTNRVDTVLMTQPDTVSTAEPNPTTWTLEIYDYNAPAQIAEPNAVQPAATAAATQSAVSSEAATTTP